MDKDKIIECLITNGIFFGTGYETEQQVSDLLFELFLSGDYEIKMNSIELKKGSKYPSDSFSDIPWHQENYYKKRRPEYLAFWCEKPGSSNEYTGLLDSNYFLNSFSSELTNWQELKIRFNRVRGESYSEWFSLVEIYNNFKGLRFAWQDSRFREVEINGEESILTLIQGLLKKTKFQKFEPKAGSLVIFNNLRFLHNRVKLNNNTKRKLIRFLIYRKNDSNGLN